jgi:hypothetical protein
MEKLSWGHLDIYKISKIEEFFHMSKKNCPEKLEIEIKVEDKSMRHPVLPVCNDHVLHLKTEIQD